MNFKIVILWLLGLTFAGSVTARLVMDAGEGEPTRGERPATAISGESLLPGGGTAGGERPAPEEDDGFLVKSLPFFTEASFFGLVGFALGYFSRKVVKLILIFVALLFVAVQVMSYAGVVSVDWSRLIDVLNGLILNLKENDTIGQVLKDRVPTAGALVAGYALGFRKG